MIAINGNSSPEDQNSKQPAPIVLLSSAELTANRVNTILRIVDSLTQKITVFNDENPFEGQTEFFAKLDGGAKMAAECTFITALDRLDKILKDDNQWHSMSAENMLADKVEELKQVQIQAENERAKMIRDLNRPCRRLNARIASLENGKFIAYLGNLSDPGLVACEADSIEAAFEALDKLILNRNDKPPTK